MTHPLANKGYAVRRLSQLLDVPASAIAAIGDGRNDVPMFAVCGAGGRDGQRRRTEVHEAADFVTAGNEEDGFAIAVERWILPRAARHAAGSAAHEGSP